MIAVEGDEYNEIFNECLRNGVSIEKLAPEKYQEYEQLCNDWVSNTLNNENTEYNQIARLLCGNSGASSPLQSGYLSDLGSDGTVSPPLSAVFSNLGSGDMDIEHEE